MAHRVVLVFPRSTYRTGDPPLGVAYLAAALRKARPALDIRIVDGTFLGGEKKLLQAVRAARGDVVGVYVDSLMPLVASRVAEAAREGGASVVAGGPHATVAAETLLPAFDAIVLGEGEPIIADVVDRAIARAPFGDVPNVVWRESAGGPPKRSCAPYRPPDLDALPFPAWDLLPMERYLHRWPYLDTLDVATVGTNIVASRGCAEQCAYCQPTLDSLFGRGPRRRSPASIVAEVEALQQRYGVRGIFFHDDTLTTRRRWLLELCEALLQMRRPILWGCNSRVDCLDHELVDAMVASGMRSIHLGIEAGSRRIREEVLHKRVDLDRLESLLAHLRHRGAHALGFFMLGSPTEDLREMLATVKLATRLDLTEATFSLTSVLPGTHIATQMSADNRFALCNDANTGIDYYNARNFSDRASLIGAGTLRAIQLGALAAFYGHPRRLGYVARHLLTRRGMMKLGMKMGRFLKL